MKNFKNISIAVTALLVLVAGYFAYTLMDKNYTELRLEEARTKVNKTEVTKALSEVLNGLNDPTSWTVGESGMYEVKYFGSVPLYRYFDKLVNVLEIEPVFEDIPNSWFVVNGLEISSKGILSQDQDGDGFSNKEEFFSESNPNDVTSMPDLINKLEVSHVVEEEWLLSVVSEDGKGGYKFSLKNEEFPKGTRSKKMYQAGDIIFPKLLKDRLLLKKVRAVEVERFGVKVEQEVFEIEDRLLGATFEIPRRIRRSDEDKYRRKDQLVSIFLNLPEHNQTIKELRIGQEFALPIDSETKSYKLISVDKKSVNFEVSFQAKDKTYIKNFDF